MELERKIYNKFIKEGYYFGEETKTNILKYEYELKQTLSSQELLLYEKITANRLELQKLECLHLIEFMMENYNKK